MLVKLDDSDNFISLVFLFDTETTLKEIFNVLNEYFRHISLLNKNKYCFCETSLFTYDFGIPLRFICLWPFLDKPYKILCQQIPNELCDHYKYIMKWTNFEEDFLEKLLDGVLTIKMHFSNVDIKPQNYFTLEWANQLIEGTSNVIKIQADMKMTKFYLSK